MSDSVKLAIVSGFDPTGVNAAKAGMASLESSASSATAPALKEVGQAADGALKTMKVAAGGAAALAGALGGGSGGIARASRAASGGLAALAAGGPWAAALAIGVSLVASLVSKFQRAKEAAEEFAKESRKAFQENLIRIQAARLDQLTERFAAVTREIKNTTRASEALNASAQRLDAARSKSAVNLLNAEKAAKLSSSEDPVERKRIEFDYARRIAAVETEAAKIAAQYAVNAAERKLKTAEAEARAAAERVGGLAAEAEQNPANRDKILKQLAAARSESELAGKVAVAARADVEAAAEELSAVLTANASIMSQAAIAAARYERMLTASTSVQEEIFKNSVRIAEHTADISALENAGGVAKVTADRGAKAASTPLNQWIENQLAADQENETSRIAEEESKEMVRKLRAKEGRGVKLSKRDDKILDFIERRRKEIEAGGAADVDGPKELVKLLKKQIEVLQEQNRLLTQNLQSN